MSNAPTTISIDSVRYVREDSIKAAPELDADHVIVRAYSGVFFAQLLGGEGTTRKLANARQIYYWDSKGMPVPAYTAGDISVLGLGAGSKVSSPVAEMTVEQVSAVFKCTKAAVASISAQKWSTR